MSDFSRIALTAGEPAGIGPDLCIQLAQYKQDCELVVIADPSLLQQRANDLGITIKLEKADLSHPKMPSPVGTIKYLPVDVAVNSLAGALDKRNARYVLELLQVALNGCLAGQFDGMVTAPVHKGVINEANIDFSGHTEFLAAGSDTDKVVMLLVTPLLRVALATTHLPLADVSAAITQHSLRQIIHIIQKDMNKYFAISNPRIAVCGLNPHAGEDGHLGQEEIEVINPVITEFTKQGYRISGSWPADTLFTKEKLKNFDVVLAMYHDQGLPVLKHHGFGQAVNVTLGLPFIRTSVDHGTALDLVGTGKAAITSLQSAINIAITMINNQ